MVQPDGSTTQANRNQGGIVMPSNNGSRTGNTNTRQQGNQNQMDGTPESGSSFQKVGSPNSQQRGGGQDWVVLPSEDGTSVNRGDDGKANESKASPVGVSMTPVPGTVGPAATGTCTTCGPYHEENIRVHMKQDWHAFNVQRKCGGLAPMTNGDYEEYLVDQAFLQSKEGGGAGKKGKKKKDRG